LSSLTGLCEASGVEDGFKVSIGIFVFTGEGVTAVSIGIFVFASKGVNTGALEGFGEGRTKTGSLDSS
ncbi:MAG: hypothetical protein PHP79_09380, partial [Clostridia bacterium]|nr:hypothetical protein [Clostridia bacterium]